MNQFLTEYHQGNAGAFLFAEHYFETEEAVNLQIIASYLPPFHVMLVLFHEKTRVFLACWTGTKIWQKKGCSHRTPLFFCLKLLKPLHALRAEINIHHHTETDVIFSRLNQLELAIKGVICFTPHFNDMAAETSTALCSI